MTRRPDPRRCPSPAPSPVRIWREVTDTATGRVTVLTADATPPAPRSWLTHVMNHLAWQPVPSVKQVRDLVAPYDL